MKPASQPFHKYTVSIFAGAVFISFSGIWVAWAQVDPMVSAFYRVFFGFIFLGIACLLQKEVLPVSRKAFGYCLLCGLFFAADLYCWHVSIRYVGPGLATILGNFQVFALTIISIMFFGQSVRWLFLVSLPLAFFGLYLVIGINWESLSAQYQIGVFFGLITAFFYTGFILSLRKFQEIHTELNYLYVLMLTSLTTCIVLGPLIMVSGKSFVIPSLTSFGSLAGLAFFSQAVGWAYITKSLPKVLPSLAGLILLLQPSLAFLWDVLLFHRETSIIQWLGVGIVIAAIYMGITSTGK